MNSSPVTVESEERFWALIGLTIVVIKIGAYFVFGLLMMYQRIEPAIGVGLALITAIGGRIGTNYCDSKLKCLPT